MADEFHLSGSWWDSSRTSQSWSTGTTMGSFGWPADIDDMKTRSPLDSEPVSGSSAVFNDTRNLQGQDSGGAGNLHMMGLGLSSQTIHWNQALLRGGKAAESSFSSILQENMNTDANFQQESGKFNHGLPCSFEMDSAVYGSPSTVFQGQRSSGENRSMNSYPGENYSLNSNQLLPSWSSSGALPQFLRNSQPKQGTQSHLQFSNNAPFWNASAAAMNDARPSYFPATLQPQFPTPILDSRKTKLTKEVQDSSSTMKKSGSDQSASKKARNETPSTLPAFKVRKEKMGDRITALQQIVSPFGKTDTASVLSEAIEYIKFLHEQVTALSTPYLKSGAPMQHHEQNSDRSKETGARQDLRSRGLCLVPISSTFPVTHETTVDFWTHTFGGTFR